MVFDAPEFEARVAKAQSAMAQSGLGAILLTQEADIRYFSGFLTRFWESPTRPWFLVLPADGKPIAVIPAIGAPLMGRGWIADIRTWDAPDPEDDGVSLLIATLREVAGDGGIGMPSDLESHMRMPRSTYEALWAEFGVQIQGDQGCVARCRAVKSPAEVGLIREACRIAGRAFARVPEVARAGQSLSDVFRAFQILCLEEGADYVPYLAGAAGEDGYEDVISPATDAPIAKGDVVMLDTGLVHRGYFCDFDRNYTVGPARNAAQNGHKRLIEAAHAAFEYARAGVTAAQVHAVMAQSLGARCGGGRLGHGLGMQLTEGLSLIPQDHTVLEAGMVLTLEPGILMQGTRMMVHEENILITDTGAEALSPFAGEQMLEIPL